MSSRLLAVRRGVNDLLSLFTLRRQFNRVGVVETCNHDIPVISYRIIRVGIIVIERVSGNSHFLIAVFRLLRRVPICWVTVPVAFDSCATWKIKS